MRTHQRPFEGQQPQRKKKKGRDSEQQSGLLNISEQLQTYIKEDDESCVEKAKSSFWPLLLSLILAAILGVIVYRYFIILNHPKANIQQNTSTTSYLHKQFPYDQKQSPVQQKTLPSALLQKHNLQVFQTKNQQNIKKQTPQDKFPSKLWIFQKSKSKNNNQKLTPQNYYEKNWQHYSMLSNLTVEKVSLQNFQNIITNNKVIQIIQKIHLHLLDSLIKQKILQIVMMFSVLQSKGGIIIGGDLILTKPLDSFLKIVEQNPDSTLFLFANSNTDDFLKINLQSYFVIGKQQCPIISQFLSKIIEILQREISEKQNVLNPSSEWTIQIYKTIENALGLFLKNNEPLKKNIYLLGKQKQIKIQRNPFLDLTLKSHFKYFYSLQQDALQEMIGPFKPIVQFPSKLYEKFIINASEQQKAQIIKNSFIYQQLISFDSNLQNSKSIQLRKQPSSTERIWELPKILWTFFTKNHMSDPFHNQFLENLDKNSKQSGFQLIILTESNLKAVFNQTQIQQIQLMLKKINQNHNQNAMNTIEEDKILSSIIKLKLLSKYGGVFVDHGYFLLQSLQWLTKISSNKHIFNKKQQNFPDSFMFHMHEDLKQWININSGQKQAKQLTYLTKFIVANKDSHFIKDWLGQVEKNLMMTQKDLQHKMESQSSMRIYKFQNIFEFTLQSMLINIRKIDPTKTETEILSQKNYNIWSINSLFAGQKMDFITKEEDTLCYSIDTSYNEFIQKYGTMGYISPLETQGTKKQIELQLKKQHDKSVFSKFFVGSDKKQKNQGEI